MTKFLLFSSAILFAIFLEADAQYYKIKWTFNNGIIGAERYTIPGYKPFDMDGDGISEIITYSKDTNYRAEIYGGVDYKLKYRIKIQYIVNGSAYKPHLDALVVYGFYDIDGDNVKELVCRGNFPDSTGMSTLGYLFVNVGTDQVEFAVEGTSVDMYPPGFADIDNDGFIEMITVRQIIGHSASLAKNPQSLFKVTYPLSKMYPNPMSGFAKIEYYVPTAAFVKIAISDVSGRLVRTLVSAGKKAGDYGEIWDGKTNDNTKCGAGEYFYTIQIGDFVTNKKIILLQ